MFSHHSLYYLGEVQDKGGALAVATLFVGDLNGLSLIIGMLLLWLSSINVSFGRPWCLTHPIQITLKNCLGSIMS